jgi:hypothetical protein
MIERGLMVSIIVQGKAPPQTSFDFEKRFQLTSRTTEYDAGVETAGCGTFVRPGEQPFQG